MFQYGFSRRNSIPLKQKPLVQEEFIFIAEYPQIAKKILTMMPPDITINRPYVEPGLIKEEKKEKRLEKAQVR